MIDFSHANSRKEYLRQKEVAADVSRQIADGDDRIVGVMIESHLIEGRQDLFPGRKPTYGQSITDACIGWGRHDRTCLVSWPMPFDCADNPRQCRCRSVRYPRLCVLKLLLT